MKRMLASLCSPPLSRPHFLVGRVVRDDGAQDVARTHNIIPITPIGAVSNLVGWVSICRAGHLHLDLHGWRPGDALLCPLLHVEHSGKNSPNESRTTNRGPDDDEGRRVRATLLQVGCARWWRWRRRAGWWLCCWNTRPKTFVNVWSRHIECVGDSVQRTRIDNGGALHVGVPLSDSDSTTCEASGTLVPSGGSTQSVPGSHTGTTATAEARGTLVVRVVQGSIRAKLESGRNAYTPAARKPRCTRILG